MNEQINILVEALAIWAPSLTAIVGVVYTVIAALSKTKAAWNELKESTDFKTLRSELETALKQNEELIHQNNLLLDQITKIKDYAEHKKKGG